MQCRRMIVSWSAAARIVGVIVVSPRPSTQRMIFESFSPRTPKRAAQTRPKVSAPMRRALIEFASCTSSAPPPPRSQASTVCEQMQLPETRCASMLAPWGATRTSTK